MSLLKPYFKKEMMYWFKTQNFLIIAAAILFFTFSTPLMLYMLPLLLKNQFPELLEMFEVSQSVSLTNFISDVYQIFGGIVLFLSYKSFTSEFKNGEFITPWLTGAKIRKVYFSKFLSISFILTILVGLTTTFSHFYAGFIFSDFSTPFLNTLNEILAVSLFIIIHLSLLLLMTSKGLSGFITIPSVFSSYFIVPGLIGFLDLKFKTPYDLIQFNFQTLRFQAVGLTLLITVLIIAITLLTLNKPIIGVSSGRKTTHLPGQARS